MVYLLHYFTDCPSLPLSPFPTHQTLIEAIVDVKTTDGYLLRLFCIGFTRKQPNQIKKTAYAKASQCRSIRRKMVEIMQKEISGVDLKEVVTKL